MKNALFILAIISTILSAIETYMEWHYGYHFSKAINNFFTWCAIFSIAFYLYLKY